MSDYQREYDQQRRERKKKAFDALVFKTFKAEPDYNRTLFQYRKIRIIMSQNMIFERAAAEQQFDMVSYVLMIAIDSQAHMVNQQRVLHNGAEPGVFKLSIDFGYTPPVTIELNPPKLLGEGR